MKQRRAAFQAIGTNWQIQADEPVADRTWSRLLDQLHDRIETFDATYSRFRPDSLVSRISEKAGTYLLPADGFKLLLFYERLYAATNGKITPLIGQTIAEAGYDASYSFETKRLHRPQRWEDVLSYNERELTVKRPVLLDFGAAGKGYLVDIVGGLVEAAGIRHYLINAGGDILRRSPVGQGIDIGLENPLDTSEVVGTAKLANGSLCASAGSKRTWGAYHHIIDPIVLRSPDQVLAAWVIADDAMTADGLATALLLSDVVVLRSQFSFSYAMLHDDMSLQYSRDFPVTVFEEARGANQ